MTIAAAPVEEADTLLPVEVLDLTHPLMKYYILRMTSTQVMARQSTDI
jgi:hypothetical protein